MKNETYVNLAIYGCKNTKITELLSIEPVKVQDKGNLISAKGSIVFKENAWIYKIEKKNIIDIEPLLENIVAIFKGKREILASISQECDIQVSVVSFMRQGVPSYHLNKEFLQFVSSINAEVDFDLYCLEYVATNTCD